MATISLKDLVKNYGKVEVLHHVEGEFQDGEFIVIVGPFWLRQIHIAAHGCRARNRHRWRDLHWRQYGQRA